MRRRVSRRLSSPFACSCLCLYDSRFVSFHIHRSRSSLRVLPTPDSTRCVGVLLSKGSLSFFFLLLFLSLPPTDHLGSSSLDAKRWTAGIASLVSRLAFLFFVVGQVKRPVCRIVQPSVEPFVPICLGTLWSRALPSALLKEVPTSCRSALSLRSFSAAIPPVPLRRHLQCLCLSEVLARHASHVSPRLLYCSAPTPPPCNDLLRVVL